MNRITRMSLLHVIVAMVVVASVHADDRVLESSVTPSLPFRSPVSAAALDAHRGGDSQVNENRLRANLGDNSASNLTTGMNAITDGSFGQASGFPMLIQNTGNNVIIQNSTILNLTVK
jgi:hypothetical protein